MKALPLCIAALLLAACDETPPPKDPQSIAAEERRDRLERKLAAATDAVEKGKTDLARKLADEARVWARDNDMMKILDIALRADQTDARSVADKVKAAAKPPCDEAFGIVIRALAQTRRKPFQKALKDRAEDSLVECATAEITAAIAKGDFAAARAVLDRPELTPTITAKRRAALATTVRDGIVESVSAQIDGEIKQGKYEEAVTKVAGAVSQGILEASDEQEVLRKVHDAAAPKQVAALTAAIGSKKAPSAPIVELERMAKALKWSILPSEIVRARLALGTWLECQRVKCKLPKPEPRFVYGKLNVHPAEASGGTVRSTLATGTKLWIVGRSGKLALIATEEPAADMSIEKRMFSAAGWVADSQLRTEDTADWLPPGEELKGMRVFGPLREADPKVLYIGFVTAIEGKNVNVKRMSDDKVVTVPRKSLHTAKLPKGQKVLAGCPGMIGISEARIDHDLPLGPRGAPMMGLVCINAAGGDGPVHDEFIGALGAKPEWLPPNKP